MEGTNFSQYLNELQVKKQSLIALAQKAAEFGWIPKNKSTDNKDKGVISLQEIIEKLEKDTLTIGVIGQMKCGKSTFLNSFVFEDNILPAATTPMTAALSVITYGEKERVVAEFYTADEWAEQKQQAERSLEDACGSLDESKIKAAKELVSKAAKLGGSLNSYLGKTKEDSFNNLIEYVGADGKYVSITKSVTIYYPKEYLKGVEIVDTPGFNDPIVSREERTKEFLKKADVVLMMLYAGRPFDATDRDIIFKNVRQCGIGKVLIGINKYDIPYCNENNPEDEEQIKQYVNEEIKKACRECDDDTLVDILKDSEPIPLSAEMALLSVLPMSKISSNEAFNFAWKRHCSNFGISSQKEMFKWSHLDNLVNAVRNLIDNEKSNILFAKPLNAIFAAANTAKAEYNTELEILKSKILLLKAPDDEIEDREYNLNKAHRRLTDKIDSLGLDIEEVLNVSVRKANYELENEACKAYTRICNIIDHEWKRMNGYDSIRPRIANILSDLYSKNIKRICDNLAETCTIKMTRCSGELFDKVQEILMKYLPDIDADNIVKYVRKDLHDRLKINEDKYKGSFFKGGPKSEIYEKGLNLIWGHSQEETEKKEEFGKELKDDFNPKLYTQELVDGKNESIAIIKELFINELIEPLQEQIKEVKEKIKNKEQEIKDSEAKREELEGKKKLIEGQINDLTILRAEIL